jgi:stage V sporulation protein G
MEITQVRVFLVDEEKLKAFVSIVFDDCFAISDIKVIQGHNGLFVSMPSKKRKNGTFRDVAHPLNSETRRMVETAIIEEYRSAVAESGGEVDAPLRDLELDEPTDGGGDDPAGRDTLDRPGYAGPPNDHRGS